MELWDQLLAEDPEDIELQFHRAKTLIAIGMRQMKLDSLQDALSSLGQARGVLETLSARNPLDRSYESSLATCYSQIGVIQSRLAISDRGLEMLESARRIQQRLVKRDPGPIENHEKLAEIINDLGYVYNYRGDYGAALGAFGEVKEICTGLLNRVTTAHKPIRYLDLLGLSYYNTADILMRRSEYGKATASYENALENIAAITRSHPSITAFKEKLGSTYRDLAISRHHEKQDQAAFASLDESFRIIRELLKAEPERAEYHFELALSWNVQGYLLDEANKNREAIAPFEAACQEQEIAVAKSKGDRKYRQFLAQHLENLGEQYVDLGQAPEGLEYYEKALRIRDDLYRDSPDDRLPRWNSSTRSSRSAGSSSTPGSSPGLAVPASGPVSYWKPRMAQNAEERDLGLRLASTLLLEANVLAASDKPKQAQAPLEHALGWLRTRVSAAADDLQAREKFSEALWDMSVLSTTLGDLKRAKEASEQRRGVVARSATDGAR